MTDDDRDTQPHPSGPVPPSGALSSVVPGPDGPEPAPPQTGPSPDTGRRRPLHWWWWLPLVVVVVALVVASRINLAYYALQPGTAQSVQQFITVPPDRAHPVHHPVMITDVRVARVTALSYFFYKLQSGTALEPVSAVVGGLPPSEFNAQGTLEMSQAEAAAKAAALTRLGYQVPSKPVGAVVFGTYAGTPAFGALGVGDVIVGVDGTAVTSSASLQQALHPYRSGQTVHLSVQRGGKGVPQAVAVTLRSTQVDTGYVDSKGQPVYQRVDLGVQTEDQVDYTYPFAVSIDVADIGGPSAGLAMTLGLIDTLTGGSLTGGKAVAATGTIDAQGDVGDVGGVAQKTVAVERAGASIFLVPKQEYAVARSEDRSGLQIYAVSSLDQALAVLAAHGGKVPPAAPAAAVPSAPATPAA